jgi:hypothetical protein
MVNLKRSIIFPKSMLRILFVGVVLFTFGAGNLPVVHAKDFELPVLAPYFSDDGLGLYNAVPLLIVMADINPARQGIKIPSPLAEYALANPDAASATFSISYIAAGDEDLWGQVCAAFPVEAQAAFNAAAAIWASTIQSSVPITVKVCWADLGSPFTLGYSGGQPLYGNFSGAPLANTCYDGALENVLYTTIHHFLYLFPVISPISTILVEIPGKISS